MVKHSSAVVLNGKKFTAYFMPYGLSHIVEGEDGKRIWVAGWACDPSKKAINVAAAFGLTIAPAV